MKSIANYWKYVAICKLRNILPCSFTLFQVSLWLTSQSDQSSVMDEGKGGSLPLFFCFPLSSSPSRLLFSTPKATYDTKREGAYFSLFSMLNWPWKMCCTTMEIHFELFKQMPFVRCQLKEINCLCKNSQNIECLSLHPLETLLGFQPSKSTR